MRGRIWIIVGVLLAAVATAGARAVPASSPPQFVVIVHPQNPVTALDRKFVADAFLKKRTRWGNDRVIKPVDLDPHSHIRARFSEAVLHRSVSAVKSYWQQLVFSGRGIPPPELDDEEDVVHYVLHHRGAIGYVSGTADLDGARVVQVR